MKWPRNTLRPAASRRVSFLEVVLAIVVFVVIAGFLLPVFPHRPNPARARRVNCAGNLKQIGLAMLMYSGDNKGYFPTTVPNWGNHFGNVGSEGYITSPGKVWSCPSAGMRQLTVHDSDYIYIGSGIKDDNDRATGTTIAFDASGNHPDNDWMNGLFIDGHVEGSKPDGSKGWNRNRAARRPWRQ